MLCKKGLLNSSVNTCIGVLSFVKVAEERPVTLFKIHSSTDALFQFCKSFKYT